MAESSKALVIGFGNAYCHDDATGPHGRSWPQRTGVLSSCDVREQIGDGTALMDLGKSADRVVGVDAVRSGVVPGTIHCVHCNQDRLPAPIFRDSTATFGLVEAVELSRALRELPSNFVIHAIEGENFEAEVGLSPAVLDAVSDPAKKLPRQIQTT